MKIETIVFLLINRFTEICLICKINWLENSLLIQTLVLKKNHLTICTNPKSTRFPEITQSVDLETLPT